MPVTHWRHLGKDILWRKLESILKIQCLTSSKMESIFSKIPNIGDKIIRELDNQSLVKCKEVQKSWYNFINTEKILWFRMIQNYIGVDNEFLTAWRTVLKKAPADFVSHVAITTQKFYEKPKIPQISPIHVAASHGNLYLFQQMMVKLANMNQKEMCGKNHPLFVAVRKGHYNICKFIVATADDKNPTRPDGVTPLLLAAQLGEYEICKLIISNVDNKNPAMHNGVTPLFVAAQNGYYEICKLIIANVENKNPARNDGETPLTIATSNGNLKICELILAHVDNKNPARSDGVTLLHIAAEIGHCEIFNLIFKSLGKNNLNPRNNQGSTPLHIASMNGHLTICKMILEEVNDKNPARDDGCTPLHLAADSGHLEIFKFISEKVRVKNPKTNNGVTPQELASKYCHLIHSTQENMSISSMIWTSIKNVWK